jgi:hypothetical protein
VNRSLQFRASLANARSHGAIRGALKQEDGPMSRDDIIMRLSSLPHPILKDVVFSDAGCEFCILTNQNGYRSLTGGNFPIFGPITITPSGTNELSTLVESEDADEQLNLLNSISEDSVKFLIEIIGEDNIEELFNYALPANRPFYVFRDIGTGEGYSTFTSRKAVCDYFFNYFIEIEEGIPWSSMDDDELTEWDSKLKQWRSNGARKLIPIKYYGV